MLTVMPLPVWTGGNVFFNGARPCDTEEDFTEDTEHKVSVVLKNNNGREPEERFEAPDGGDIIFDKDHYGNRRGRNPVAGPFSE